MTSLTRHSFFALCVAPLAFLPAGCDLAEVFGSGYDLPPSADVPEGDWPKLADTDFIAITAAQPDPAQGEAVLENLGAQAQQMDARADKLAGSGLSADDVATLDEAGSRKRQD